jgi:hypothetical protein
MYGRAVGVSLLGIGGRPITVEAFVGRGLPSFIVTGLPGAAVNDARERIRPAVEHANLEWPLRRVIVNLAPANVRKEGPGLDLPIAVAVLGGTKRPGCPGLLHPNGESPKVISAGGGFVARRSIVSGVGLALGLAVVVLTILSATGESGPESGLSCSGDNIQSVIGEYDVLAPTWQSPDEAVLGSGALDAIGVPTKARHITEDPSPVDGIVFTDSLTTNSAVADKSDGGKYVVFVEEKVLAELAVETTPDGGYWVGSYQFCN